MKHDKITIDEAIRQVCAYAKPVQSETVHVLHSINRILSEDVYTLIDQPPFPRSAMDGYAVNYEDIKEVPVTLKVAGNQFAGDAPFRMLEKGEALRIMTGACIPEGCDVIIPQEMTDYGREKVTIYKSLPKGAHYCDIGEDFHKGELLAVKGDVIDAYFIASAIAAGIEYVKVRQKIMAAIITTGDELQDMGKPLQPGKIYNSNLALFSTRLNQLGCDVILSMSAGDDIDTIKKAISNTNCDLIITTGGVSVGIKDVIPQVMEELHADIIFHGVNVKPGMPTMYSIFNGIPVIGLSGNPYSASAIFELLVQPLLKEMNQSNKVILKEVEGISFDDFPINKFSTRFLRGYYIDGIISFSKGQHNGQTKAGIGTNCLIRINQNETITKGSKVKAYLI
ncbi:MAG: molybdopterin molybdotransferase MoeA [Holdemanella sp.]|nr:molybdopterin molybdotransferase MoeA [Holdemanella sp.]